MWYKVSNDQYAVMDHPPTTLGFVPQRRYTGKSIINSTSIILILLSASYVVQWDGTVFTGQGYPRSNVPFLFSGPMAFSWEGYSGQSRISQTGGRQLPWWGRQPITWPNFYRKLHENERIWTERGTCIPLDPPMGYLWSLVLFWGGGGGVTRLFLSPVVPSPVHHVHFKGKSSNIKYKKY